MADERDPNEASIYELADYPPMNGHGAGVTYAADDDDLDAFEGDDEGADYRVDVVDEVDEVDDDLLQLQARTEQLAQAYEQREASRVHRKVAASATGAAVAGGVPAILAAVNALNLPADLQPLVLAAAAVIGTLVAGYVTPERKPAV
jgi:hypothetical protein